MPQYRVRPDAERDIFAQAAYYEEKGSRETAVRWLVAAYETFDQIAAGRRIGEKWPSNLRAFRDIRVTSVIDFPGQIVVYRVTAAGVVVLRVRGGRENLDRILGPRR